MYLIIGPWPQVWHLITQQATFLVVEMFQSASRRASYRAPPANRHRSSPPPTTSFFQMVLSRAAIHDSAALIQKKHP